MKCSWCEEEGKKMFRGCNIKGHDVCEECYGKYRKMYPLRVDGCPYCIGIEEVAVEEVAVKTIVRIVNLGTRFGDNFFFIVIIFLYFFFANCNYNDVKLYLKLYLKIPSCYLLH